MIINLPESSVRDYVNKTPRAGTATRFAYYGVLLNYFFHPRSRRFRCWAVEG